MDATQQLRLTWITSNSYAKEITIFGSNMLHLDYRCQVMLLSKNTKLKLPLDINGLKSKNARLNK